MTESIIPKRRLITEKNNLIEITAWKINKSINYPEGIKYSFTFVHDEKRTIAFDNYNNEGHHMHFLNKKEKYKFVSLEKTMEIFFNKVEEFENNLNDK
ncbi:hypothetical protein HOD20_05000 [archaeon]|jgi:hypothetical protein|nr:hypothetical protein [archaeon]MBT4351861.1 hypothetical protein [archaeon]MBT4647632.1 hypothetical protein [archaeon]MBT6822608.1 hypothetical protein [archaeon]MBT7392793.1 hypothetical protein [archaeon]